MTDSFGEHFPATKTLLFARPSKPVTKCRRQVSEPTHATTPSREPRFFFRLIPSKLVSLLVPLDWEVFPHAPGTTKSLNVGYLLIILPALIGFIAMVRERVNINGCCGSCRDWCSCSRYCFMVRRDFGYRRK